MEKNNKTENWLYEQINITGKGLAILFKGKKRLKLLKLQKKGHCFRSYRSKRDSDEYREKLYETFHKIHILLGGNRLPSRTTHIQKQKP